MYEYEADMQKDVHENPMLILSGIPEINPGLCDDAPMLFSLGREIPLKTGPVDNLFIDINGVLTFVECKRYGDGRLKREAYPQAINYASDLQGHLIHYNGSQFIEELFGLISQGKSPGLSSFAEVVDMLSSDPALQGKRTNDWKKQFLDRVEHNIKTGICRVVILCAPDKNTAFNQRAIRNLMQLMTFSEHMSLRYDLILMDIREEDSRSVSKIIWRRYAELPKIPLIAESVRDTARAIEKVKKMELALPAEMKESLDAFLGTLPQAGLFAKENASGYSIRFSPSGRSIYIQVQISEDSWSIVRHQIRPPEELFHDLKSRNNLEFLEGFEFSVKEKNTSTLGSGELLELEILEIPMDKGVDKILQAIMALANKNTNYQ